MVAEVGLPAYAASLLQMEFSNSTVSHNATMRKAGLRDQAGFGVMGGD